MGGDGSKGVQLTNSPSSSSYISAGISFNLTVNPQALLLSWVGRYGLAYGFLGHSVRCVNFISGADHRLAYGIGLHRGFNIQSQTGRTQNLIEVEERKRAFWCIFYLDTSLSLVLGRPP